MRLRSARQKLQRSCARSCYTSIIPYLLTALYYIRSHHHRSSNIGSMTVQAYTYNSYPFLYVNDQQQATNATYPIQEHIPIKVNDVNDRPDFLYHPQPGEYRVVEYYVHCTLDYFSMRVLFCARIMMIHSTIFITIYTTVFLTF
jgi:hypothetical protein